MIEFHASLILCLMFVRVSGGPFKARCLQTLKRELSSGERRFAAAVGILMTSTSSWQPQSWKVSMILPSLWMVDFERSALSYSRSPLP